MPSTYNDERNARRHAPHNTLPRRALIDPYHKSYNSVIRLEGQINSIIQIQRFLWRYKVCNNLPTMESESAPDPTTFAGLVSANSSLHNQTMRGREQSVLEKSAEQNQRRMIDAYLDTGRMVYFDMIEELIDKFLNKGIDLAYEGHNVGSFVAMIKRNYLQSLPKEEREKEGLWAKIWWFQRLQQILQDENTSMTKALVEGWHCFIDAEQWPTKSAGRNEYTEMWKSLESNRQQSFLDEFAIDEEKLKTWMSGLSSRGFCCERVAEEEAQGLQREFMAAGIELTNELNGPKPVEEALEDGLICPLCGEGYSLEGYGTEASHVPVRVTPFDYACGWRCLAAQTQDLSADGKCATCRVRLSACTTPRSLVDGCDEILRWLHPPIELQNTTGLHSFLSKLMLVFETAEEIRKRLRYWLPHVNSIDQNLSRLGDLGLYLARERMAAVAKKDVARYREVVIQQMQATTQRLWFEFLDNVLPDIHSLHG